MNARVQLNFIQKSAVKKVQLTSFEHLKIKFSKFLDVNASVNLISIERYFANCCKYIFYYLYLTLSKADSERQRNLERIEHWKASNKKLQEEIDRKKEAVVIQKEVKENYKPPNTPAVRPALNVSRPKRTSKKPQNARLKIKIKPHVSNRRQFKRKKPNPHTVGICKFEKSNFQNSKLATYWAFYAHQFIIRNF